MIMKHTFWLIRTRPRYCADSANGDLVWPAGQFMARPLQDRPGWSRIRSLGLQVAPLVIRTNISNITVGISTTPQTANCGWLRLTENLWNSIIYSMFNGIGTWGLWRIFTFQRKEVLAFWSFSHWHFSTYFQNTWKIPRFFFWHRRPVGLFDLLFHFFFFGFQVVHLHNRKKVICENSAGDGLAIISSWNFLLVLDHASHGDK